MKKSNILSIAGPMILLFGLSSCIEEKGIESKPKNINLYVAGIDTKTTSDNINKSSLHPSNIVGAFGVVGDETIINGKNNKYTVGSDNKLITETEMQAQELTNSVSIYAYAPYQEDWNSHKNNLNFKVSSDQSTEAGYLASDLLYATAGIDQVKGDQQAVGLNFKHKMARVKLTITVAEEADDLSEAAVYVNNTKLNTTFNLSSGTLGNAEGSAQNITACNKLGSNTQVYSVVVPQTLNEGTSLFTIDNTEKTYTLNLQNSITFESGKSYSFSVTINPTTPEDIDLKFDGDNSVSDWEEENGESYETEEDKQIIKEINLDQLKLGKEGTVSAVTWDWDTHVMEWWYPYGSSTYMLQIVPAGTDMTTEEYKAFHSLVVQVSNYSSSDNQETSYLNLRTRDTGIFKSSNTEEFKISSDGIYTVDLTQFGNETLFDNESGLRLYGVALDNNSDSSHPYSVKIERIYFSTKKVN